MKKKAARGLIIVFFACGMLLLTALSYVNHRLGAGSIGNGICSLTGLSPVKEHSTQMLAMLKEQAADPALDTTNHARYILFLSIYERMILLQISAVLLLLAGTVLEFQFRAKTRKKQRMDTQHITRCGMLLALMLILGYVEKLVAPGSHGIKLGISNSVLIFAVYMLDIPTAYILMIYKVVLSSALFGSFGTSFLIALAGGFVSLTLMVLISRIQGMHPATISAVGGAFHNIGQTGMAILLVPGNVTLVAGLPLLILTGAGFGLITGICAAKVMKHLKHMRF